MFILRGQIKASFELRQMQSKYVIHYHSLRNVNTAILFDFQIYERLKCYKDILMSHDDDK